MKIEVFILDRWVATVVDFITAAKIASHHKRQGPIEFRVTEWTTPPAPPTTYVVFSDNSYLLWLGWPAKEINEDDLGDIDKIARCCEEKRKQVLERKPTLLERFWADIKTHKFSGQEAPRGWFRVKTFDDHLLLTLSRYGVHHRIRDGFKSGAVVVTFRLNSEDSLREPV